MQYSINKKFNNFMKKIYKRLEDLRSSDLDEVESYDGHDYDGYWSWNEGFCTLSQYLPLNHLFSMDVDYEDPNFSNKELDEKLRNLLNNLLDYFKEDNPEAWNQKDSDTGYFSEKWHEYLSDSYFSKEIIVQLRPLKYCSSEEQDKYKRYKYLIYIQGFLNDEYRVFGEMREDIVIPVKLKDLKGTLNKVFEGIDIMREEYNKIGDVL